MLSLSVRNFLKENIMRPRTKINTAFTALKRCARQAIDYRPNTETPEDESFQNTNAECSWVLIESDLKDNFSRYIAGAASEDKFILQTRDNKCLKLLPNTSSQITSRGIRTATFSVGGDDSDERRQVTFHPQSFQNGAYKFWVRQCGDPPTENHDENFNRELEKVGTES